MNHFLFILGYYIVWFGGLTLAAYNQSSLSLLLSIMISAAQLYFLCNPALVRRCTYFLVLLPLFGFLVDSILSYSNFIIFNANPWSPLAPPWILALWLNFAVFCVGYEALLKRLGHYLWIFALIGFPAAYLAGLAFHVATFKYGNLSALVMGLIWMPLFPLMCFKCLFENKIIQ